MFKSLKELFYLLNLEQRANLYLLQILIIIMSFLEVLSVLSVGPFVTFLGNPDILNSNKDQDFCTLQLSNTGILKLKFESEDINSEYFIARNEISARSISEAISEISNLSSLVN